MLCCAALRCAALCCAVLCCAVPCRAVPCRAVLCCAVLWEGLSRGWAAQRYTTHYWPPNPNPNPPPNPNPNPTAAQRYTTKYWAVLARAGTGVEVCAQISDAELDAAIALRNSDCSRVVVAPLVSRHFDFLDALVTGGGLPLSPAVLKVALSGTVLLVGSAPVGPTTVRRLQAHAGRLPTVRFGSTETTLQARALDEHLMNA